MAWNKCSEKLPEVGMLILCRETYGPYENNTCYYGGVVLATDKNEPVITVCDDIDIIFSPKTTLMRDLEWKEVEKD